MRIYEWYLTGTSSPYFCVTLAKKKKTRKNTEEQAAEIYDTTKQFYELSLSSLALF